MRNRCWPDLAVVCVFNFGQFAFSTNPTQQLSHIGKKQPHPTWHNTIAAYATPPPPSRLAAALDPPFCHNPNCVARQRSTARLVDGSSLTYRWLATLPTRVWAVPP